MLLHLLFIFRENLLTRLTTVVLHLHGIRIPRRRAAPTDRPVGIRHLRARAEGVLHIGKLLGGQLIWWNVRCRCMHLATAALPLDRAIVETVVSELVAIVCELDHFATVTAHVEQDEDDNDDDESDDTTCKAKRVC